MQINQKTIKATIHICLKRITVIMMIVGLSFAAHAIDYSVINTSYWYDLQADVRVLSRAAKGDSSTVVFLDIQKRTNLPLRIRFLLQTGFENANHQVLEGAVIDTLFTDQNGFLLRLIFDTRPETLLTVELSDQIMFYYFPVILENLPSFYPVDDRGLPLTRPYFSKSISFRFLSGVADLITFQYTDDFGPADPPMGSTATLSPGLKLDSVVVGWPRQTHDGKYYLVQQDTLSSRGVTLMCLPEYYPEVRTLPEVIESVGYAAKRSEYLSLRVAEDKKQAFDRHWLQLFTNTTDARLAIKKYYSGVRAANVFFSHYKPGWKNDPGMIYIVFGKPGAVYRFNNREIWVYEGITFEFRILSHLFTSELKILIRKLEYEREWYMRVRELRGGN